MCIGNMQILQILMGRGAPRTNLYRHGDKTSLSFFFFFLMSPGSSHHGSVEMNLTSIQEDAGSIPGLAQRVKNLALS